MDFLISKHLALKCLSGNTKHPFWDTTMQEHRRFQTFRKEKVIPGKTILFFRLAFELTSCEPANFSNRKEGHFGIDLLEENGLCASEGAVAPDLGK